MAKATASVDPSSVETPNAAGMGAPHDEAAASPSAPLLDALALQKRARLGMIVLGFRTVLMQFTILGGVDAFC